MSAATIAVSEDLRGYLIDRFHARAERVFTIHNGVALPPTDLLPNAAALAARENIVLGVGRLVPEKGFAFLIDAFAKSKLASRLILLGEGSERTKLEAQVAQLGLSGRVELRGYVQDLATAFAQAKMLALSSRSEAFGNVIVEALAYGLPVVATTSGGPPEILDNGRFGRLVAIDDAAAMARAIDETLADPGDPAGHRARAETFSLDRALDRFEALIEQVTRAR
jgi:glycosyltransferase involved in cell wall biosynthesis